MVVFRLGTKMCVDDGLVRCLQILSLQHFLYSLNNRSNHTFFPYDLDKIYVLL